MTTMSKKTRNYGVGRIESPIGKVRNFINQ